MRDIVLLLAGFCSGVCVVETWRVFRAEGYTWEK